MPRTARTLQALVAAAVASCLVASVLAYPYYFPFRNVAEFRDAPPTRW